MSSCCASPTLRPAMPAPFRLPKRLFIGGIITSASKTELRVIERGLLGVGSTGVIRFVEDLEKLAAGQKGVEEGEDQQKEGEGKHAGAGAGANLEANGLVKGVSENTIADEDRSATPVPEASSGGAAGGMTEQPNELQMPPPALPTKTTRIDEATQRENELIKKVVEANGWRVGDYKIVRLERGSFICSGFIDTHTHACQVPNIGLGQQYELLDWLKYVTFPRERRFEDPRYARKTYDSVVQRLIDSGTTTACYYATLHLEATKMLAEICNERGQRAFVGKCQMDRNSPIDYIEKNASQSIEDTKEFIRFTRALRPYGQAPDASSPLISPADSSGSPEMDASIARLSATMNEMMASQPGGAGAGSAASSLPTETKALPPPAKIWKPAPVTKRPSEENVPHRTASNSSLRSLTRGAPGGPAPGSGSISPRARKEASIANALVHPILTPRFAISCSDAMLAGIAALLARDPTLRIQTHLSENEGEISFTKKLFPFAKSYTHVYDHYALLGPRTILAHAIHLDDDEMELIRKKRCGVSHCPTSNFNLRSGTSRVGEMLNKGIKVGLGTDVSGGFGLSMLTAIREASVVAKVLALATSNRGIAGDGTNLEGTELNLSKTLAEEDKVIDGRYPLPAVDGKFRPRPPAIIQSPTETNTHGNAQSTDFTAGPLSIATLYYLATLGGAEVCSMAHKIGSLAPGKEFDALLVQTTSVWQPGKGYTGNPNMYVEPEDSLADLFEKWLFCGDDRNITSVFVRGRVIGGANPIG